MTDTTPTTTPAPRTAAVLDAVRRSGVFRTTVPLETSTGWPVPVTGRWNGATGVGISTILFASRGGDDGIELFAPFAEVTATWPDGVLVRFTDLRWDPPGRAPDRPADGEPIGTYPHPGAPRTLGEYREQRHDVLGRYDELLTTMADGSRPTEAWWESFGDALGPLIEPCLVPWYRSLDPVFAARVIPS